MTRIESWKTGTGTSCLIGSHLEDWLHENPGDPDAEGPGKRRGGTAIQDGSDEAGREWFTRTQNTFDKSTWPDAQSDR